MKSQILLFLACIRGLEFSQLPVTLPVSEYCSLNLSSLINLSHLLSYKTFELKYCVLSIDILSLYHRDKQIKHI